MSKISHEARQRLGNEYCDHGLTNIGNWVKSGAADDSTHTPALIALTKLIEENVSIKT